MAKSEDQIDEARPVTTEQSDGDALPMHYEKVQGAVWLIGLAILAWQNWWWPGILVLVAISGLTQAGLKILADRQQQAHAVAELRQAVLPDTCPRCGSPLSAEAVKWTGPASANCPYCGTVVTARSSLT